MNKKYLGRFLKTVIYSDICSYKVCGLCQEKELFTGKKNTWHYMYIKTHRAMRGLRRGVEERGDAYRGRPWRGLELFLFTSKVIEPL